jgi:hypothetical protein
LRWADQVTQMDENKSPQQISCTNTGGQWEMNEIKMDWWSGVGGRCKEAGL